MPAHDIIDNRRVKLVDHIRQILDSTEAGRFAVGYFFVSGLEAIGDRLASVKELRLLIGDTTDRRTLDQIAEGRHRIELMAGKLEDEAYPKRVEIAKSVSQTGENVRKTMEFMDQTDESEALILTLVMMIEEGRLQVRVYTK